MPSPSHPFNHNRTPGDAWDDAKDKELQFQELKRVEAHLHSIQEGTMLASEYTVDDAATAELRKDHIVALRMQREKAAQKKSRNLKAAIKPDILSGCTLFVDALLPRRLDPQRLAAMRGCDIVRVRTSAECFLVTSPCDLVPETRWAVSLNGGLVIDAHFLQGGHGSAIVYQPAIESGGTRANPRRFWCSEKFKREKRSLYDILVASSLTDASVWREIGRVAWAAEVEKDQRRPPRQRRPMCTVAIVNDAAQASQLGMPNVFEPDAFISKFSKIRRGAAGVCLL